MRRAVLNERLLNDYVPSVFPAASFCGKTRYYRMMSLLNLAGLLAFLAALIPFQFYVNLGFFPIAIGYIYAAFLGALATIKILKKGKVIVPRLMKYILLFIAAIALSYPSAPSKSSFWMDFVQLVLYFSLYFWIVNILQDIDAIKKIVRIVYIASIINAFLGIVQFLLASINPEIVLGLWYDRLGKLIFGVRGLERISSVEGRGFFFRSELPGIGTAFRAFGVFGGGNAYGFFQAMMFPLVLEVASQRQGWIRRGKILFVLANFISVLLSWSRMGWLMVLVGGIYWGTSRLFRHAISIFSPLHLFKLLGMSVLSISIILIFTSLFPGLAISQAVTATLARSDASTVSRLLSMQRGIEIFLEHKWFGGGFGNYASLVTGVNLNQPTVITAESLYIELLAEVGIFGLLTFLVLMISVWREIWYVARVSHEYFRMFGRSMCAMWLVVMVGFLFNAGLIEPRTMLMWWFVVGLTSAIRRIETRATGRKRC